MRLPLANTLKTRSGDHSKDARNVNAYPDVKEGQAIVRKRPGCVKTGFDFTTPLQGFSSIADLLQYMEYGEYSNINNVMFSLYGDYYYLIDIYVPEYQPDANYVLGDRVYINKTNYVFGETEEGEIWYAMMPIDSADQRLRPNYNFNDYRYPSRGMAWSKTPPTGTTHTATYAGADSGICGSREAAGYAAWINKGLVPNPAGWSTYSHIAPAGAPWFYSYAVYGQQWQGTTDSVNFGIAVMGQAY